MNHKTILNSLLATSAILPSVISFAVTPTKPNIVILLADDMGYGELGSYGQQVIKTPFLDSFAKQGLRFTEFYAGTSVSSPSRASLMTGLHTGHTNIRGNGGQVTDKIWDRIPLKKSETTLAEMLKTVGYQTAMIGKWHLDVPEDTSTWAAARGFDYAVQEQWGISAQGEELDERMHWINNRMDSSFYDYTKYKCLDEFRTNFALDYLDKKDDKKPFFLYMSYRIPHAHEFKLTDNDMYAGRGWPEVERRHASRITMFDEQVKRLIDRLKERGELNNTLIIFMSDNGPHSENWHDYKFFNSSGVLRGYKRDLHEGGIRVPCFMYWEGKIKGGTETANPAVFYDMMPTLAKIAGAKAPTNIDGISILPLMLGKKQKQHKFFYWEIQEGKDVSGFKQAARMGKWKAVRIADSYKTELYDLEKDVSEKTDLSAQYPAIVAQMEKIMKKESVKNIHFPYSGGVFK